MASDRPSRARRAKIREGQEGDKDPGRADRAYQADLSEGAQKKTKWT